MSSVNMRSPPPPSGSSSSLYSGNSKNQSHPSWNSFVSDITMTSDDEQQHRHYAASNISSTQNQPLRFYPPLKRNEDSGASLMEYSQSSEEGHQEHDTHQHHHRNSTNTSGSGLFASASSTSFRFRQDITASSRLVQFETSSDEDDHSSGASSNARHQAAEEGGIFRNKHHKSRDNHHHHHHQQQRGGRATVNRETFLSTPNRWMTQLAYSFRTPEDPKHRKKPDLKKNNRKVEPSKKTALSHVQYHAHRRNEKNNGKSSNMKQPRSLALKDEVGEELQPATLTIPVQHQQETHTSTSEHSPLLPLKGQETVEDSTFPRLHHHQTSQLGHRKLCPTTYRHRHRYDFISMAVAFLQDYEAARPPTLASNVTWITPWHMGLYRLKYSAGYSILIFTATLALFLSSCLEGPSPTDSTLRMHILTGLNMYALAIFAMDMWIRTQFQKHFADSNITSSKNAKTKKSSPPMQSRTSHANLLMRPLCLFGLFLGLENLGWLLARPDRHTCVLFSSILKPVVLYYISSQARHAMEALARIAKIVSRVLLIEMVLILSFAAVACRLFHDFEPFGHLSVSWLSLFKCKFLGRCSTMKI